MMIFCSLLLIWPPDRRVFSVPLTLTDSNHFGKSNQAEFGSSVSVWQETNMLLSGDSGPWLKHSR